MANRVYNKVKTNRNIRHVDIFTDGNFDFNKLIPMPEELQGSEASVNGLLLLFQTTKEKIKYGLNPTRNALHLRRIRDAYSSTFYSRNCDIEKALKEYFGLFSKLPKDKEKELLQAGKENLDNFEKYGYCNWYDWAINNWNTKWNATDTQIINDTTIEFTTAWSMPVNVIMALSRTMQGDKIEITWASDGGGRNVGRGFLKNGLWIKGGYLEPCTKEWMEVFNEMLGYSFDKDK